MKWELWIYNVIIKLSHQLIKTEFLIYSPTDGSGEDDQTQKQNSKMVMGKHSPDSTDTLVSPF